MKQFFEEWHQPTYGERMAKAFAGRYQELRGKTPPLHPNEVFDELQRWTGGAKSQSATRLASVLAVLAYFFDPCDIFEPAGKAKAMILPSKHLSGRRALLTVGGEILELLDRPRTVSSLWEELRGAKEKPSYDAFPTTGLCSRSICCSSWARSLCATGC